MSTVLLDTNALAMVLTDDPRLTAQAREAIVNAPLAAVSAISFYEIGQKVRLGKWDEMAPFARQLPEIISGDGFTLLPVTGVQALDASLLDWSHRDPFDRMIAATARSESATLVSSDTAFDDLTDIVRIWG